jgi:uncharacterized NAD(P)/FAD-binding protein YdhS
VAERPLTVALVGAGPTASSLVERIGANLDLLGGRPLRIELIDPHRAGTGRVWRPDLSPLLWMNSLAEDVTMFVDDSVRCEGPPRPGPTLFEWSRCVDDRVLDELDDPDLAEEIRGLTPTSFPTRRVQSAYLDWFHRWVIERLPAHVTVVHHQRRAIELRDRPDGAQRLVLDDGAVIDADTVVLAQGHLDSLPDDRSSDLARFADEHGLVYLPPGHTAEQDLDVIPTRARVGVLGFGQAFTDLLVLLTEGRGGRFEPRSDGRLRYVPSGREPVVLVGSRRGVPYRSKLDYRLPAPLAPLPHVLDEVTMASLVDGDGPLDFTTDVLPLVIKELQWASAHQLFHAHPERTSMGWDEFVDAFDTAAPGAEVDSLIARAVPDPADRLDIARLDRPLAGRRDLSASDAHQRIVRHIRSDVGRRTDPAFSQDLAVFHALLFCYAQIGRITASGRLSERSRIDQVGGWWFSFFMYYASGPPPARLRQLLAITEAGLVQFVGADARVVCDPSRGRFFMVSASHDERLEIDAVVEARIPGPALGRTTDPLLRDLSHRGDAREEVVEEVVDDVIVWSRCTGRLVVGGPDLRVERTDGSLHDRRHALGGFTNRPAAGAFARPRTNAPAFRQNDLVARSILRTLAALDAGHDGIGT